MTNERLIWRPNAIPQDVWDAMSRDDQVKQWRTQATAIPKPKRHMRDAIALYNGGALNIDGFCALVFELASEDELPDFVNECPVELLAEIKTCLKSYGTDENEWPRFFQSACYAPWVSLEEIAESIRGEQQRIWNGVRLLKTFGPPFSES